MAETKIEWADRVWNPIAGCSIVSPGCTNCYAMRMADRLERMGQPKYLGLTQPSKAGPVWTGKIAVDDKALLAPLSWRKPARVFVNSMSDLFHPAVADEVIDRIFTVMALAPHLTFLVLTKRPDRMRNYVAAIVDTFHASPDSMNERFGDLCVDITASPCAAGAFEDIDWPLPNVWLGVSVERQAEADARIPDLLATPAAVRFISAEPLLGQIDLTRIDDGLHDGVRQTFNALTGMAHDGEQSITGIFGQPDPKIDWVIAGFESGPRARPGHPDLVRSLRDQCASAGTAFFFKQWGPGRTGCLPPMPRSTRFLRAEVRPGGERRAAATAPRPASGSDRAMTAHPIRLQLSRKRGFDMQAISIAANGLPAVNVARPSRWGNPFDFRYSEYCWIALSYGCNGGRLGRQEASVRAFREWITPLGLGQQLVSVDRGVSLGDGRRQVQIGPRIAAGAPPTIDEIQTTLRGHNLACWCKPGEPCHADVLIEMANPPCPTCHGDGWHRILLPSTLPDAEPCPTCRNPLSKLCPWELP